MHDRLARATWPTVVGAPLVLVPLGSTEQHGPHLPLSTDTVIATAVAERLRELLDETVVAPAVPYGASGEHQDFPGTVSIGTEALTVVIVELVRSLSTWAGGVLIVNGHGGNLDALAAAVPQLVGEGHPVAWVPCAVRGGDAHAGRTETSLLLHIDPAAVALELAEPGTTTPMPALLGRLASDGVRAVSANGILGDPTGASADEGGDLLAEMADGIVRRLVFEQQDARGCLTDPGAP